MSLLSSAQTHDLVALQKFCDSLATPIVVIGALAYQAFISGSHRYTVDVDVAMALELDEYDRFKDKLIEDGWEHDRNQEQRWRGPSGSMVDILPTGPKARRVGHITWPESEMRMSLVGFEHVFLDAVHFELAPGFRMKVVPPPVLFLLKVVAFLDDEQRRAKDLEDIHGLVKLYEWESERLYSEEVFDAELPDIQFAPAFLLALEVGKICNPEELRLVRSFLARARNTAFPLFHTLLTYEGRTAEAEQTMAQRLEVFELGLNTSEQKLL